jgi:hypothetical protein
MTLAPFQIFDPDGAMAFEENAGCERFDLDREVGPGQRRSEIGHGGTASTPVADGLLRASEPLLLRPIVVLGHRVTGHLAGRQIGLDERVLVARRPRRQRAVTAAIDEFRGTLA